MRRLYFFRFVLFFLLFNAGCSLASLQAKEFPFLKMPEGFQLSSYAHVPGARFIEPVTELDAIFISTRGDTVYILENAGITKGARVKAKLDRAKSFLSGLNSPNGIAWRGGYLYIVEQHRIIRLTVKRQNGRIKKGRIETLFRGLPNKRWHGWRVARFGPDGKLYIAVGVACNICRLKGYEGSILQFDIHTRKAKIYARGVRNSVGLAFHPISGKLYFTDNGADNMGDDLPPDELNRADQAGQHFGFPFYGGGKARTWSFRRFKLPRNTVAPIVEFGAHVAPLGLHFYQGSRFPDIYRNSLFIAQHGSWNRSVPDGYRIKFVQLDARGNVMNSSNFIEGWLKRGKNGRYRKDGRPVDITELPDGSLLISDDKADKLYRLTYEK